MVKRNSNLPSSDGGIITGLDSSYHSKITFSPKLVILFAIVCVFIIWLITFISK